MSSKKKPKHLLGKIWYFIWYDDSALSWIVNVILAFLIVKFIFYPGLSLIVGTPLPLVAVTSSSMEHRPGDNSIMCGVQTNITGKINLEDWWDICGNWYLNNTNITIDDFKDYTLKNGFNKGDIVFLKSKKNIDVGDIIVFNSGKQYPIIHRVINTGDALKTKGDNNPGLIKDSQLNEEKIDYDAVLGKAYAKIPYLGYIKIWFTDLLNLLR